MRCGTHQQYGGQDKAKQVEFSPARPIPRVFDIQARIKTLQGYLHLANPSYESERQHDNIRAAIKLYEEGKIHGIQRTTVIDGKIAPFEDGLMGDGGVTVVMG